LSFICAYLYFKENLEFGDNPIMKKFLRALGNAAEIFSELVMQVLMFLFVIGALIFGLIVLVGFI